MPLCKPPFSTSYSKVYIGGEGRCTRNTTLTLSIVSRKLLFLNSDDSEINSTIILNSMAASELYGYYPDAELIFCQALSPFRFLVDGGGDFV